MKRNKPSPVFASSATQDFDYVDSQESLETLIDELLLEERIAVDTEFHREKTYYPSVALVQIAHSKGISLVDPLKVEPKVFAKLLDSEVLIIMHAASQDLEVFQRICGVVPRRLFDTQIAAGFIGMSNPSLATLCEKQLGIVLKKESRFTDWMTRPLSSSQLEYAANDVRHLLEVHYLVNKELTSRRRIAWVEAELALFLEQAKRRREPEHAWKKIKEGRNLSGKALNNIRALAAWREIKASNLNIPVRYVFPDLALAAIAQHEPTDIESLENVRGVESRHLKGPFPEEIFLALKNAKKLDPLPKVVKRGKDTTNDLRAGVTLVSAWIAQIARELELDPAMLGTRSDIEALVRGDPEARMGSGWRHQIVGEPVKELLQGKAALAFDTDGGLVLERREKR